MNLSPSDLWVRMLWRMRNSDSAGANSHSFIYGNSNHIPIVGDWNNDGIDTPGVVIGNQWHLNNGFDGSADLIFGYGSVGDVPIVGDWDNDGDDTPGVIKGNVWYLNNGTDPNADIVFGYGSASDTFVSMNWAGGGDRPGVIKEDPVLGKHRLLNFEFDANHDAEFVYGSANLDGIFDPTDHVPIDGDWNGGVGPDTPGIVIGETPPADPQPTQLLSQWHLNTDFDGDADVPIFVYGLDLDSPFGGDWDDNNTSTPGIVRGTTQDSSEV